MTGENAWFLSADRINDTDFSKQQLDALKKQLQNLKKSDTQDVPRITMVWHDDKDTDFGKILKAASGADVRVSVRFPNLNLDQITDVIFRYKCVDPIVVSTFRLTKEKGLKIGTEWPSDIDGYEKRRLHSLILHSAHPGPPRKRHPAMPGNTRRDGHGFVNELRDVILAMKRPSVAMRWDPDAREKVLAERKKETWEFTKLPPLVQLYETFGPTDEKTNDKQYEGHSSRAGQVNAVEAILGDSDKTRKEMMEADGWGGRRIHLLVTGESGTGKSLVAELAHEVLYARDDRPKLVRVNCGARRETDLEFELFGSTTGKYTGVGVTIGLLARAAFGTAFLDEFGDMPASCQPTFLTYLDDLMIRPKGEMPPFFSYSYVVAATNRDLNSLIRATEFRNDLVQRFARQVRIPSVRERSRKEILELIDMAAQHPDENKERRINEIAPEATQLLLSHEYRDGNIRELESIVHQALQAARRRNSRVIEVHDLDIPDYPSFRPDSERNVVNVKEFPDELKTRVSLKDHRDLDRISERSGRPILKVGDAYGVILDGVLYESPSRSQ